jgi:magnesium-transporting ATPase (P-type)
MAQPAVQQQVGFATRLRNMAFSSTLVTYGVGTGVVVAVGDATEVGRISELIASAPTLETPLTRRIHHFSGYCQFLWMTG